MIKRDDGLGGGLLQGGLDGVGLQAELEHGLGRRGGLFGQTAQLGEQGLLLFGGQQPLVERLHAANFAFACQGLQGGFHLRAAAQEFVCVVGLHEDAAAAGVVAADVGHLAHFGDELGRQGCPVADVVAPIGFQVACGGQRQDGQEQPVQAGGGEFVHGGGKPGGAGAVAVEQRRQQEHGGGKRAAERGHGKHGGLAQHGQRGEGEQQVAGGGDAQPGEEGGQDAAHGFFGRPVGRKHRRREPVQREVHQHPHQAGADHDGEDVNLPERAHHGRRAEQHARAQRQHQRKHARAAEHGQQQGEGKRQADGGHQATFVFGLGFGFGGKQCAAGGQQAVAAALGLGAGIG